MAKSLQPEDFRTTTVTIEVQYHKNAKWLAVDQCGIIRTYCDEPQISDKGPFWIATKCEVLPREAQNWKELKIKLED